jgi:hypothetical protein
MAQIDTHPFWGNRSPLAHVSYIPFLLYASVRFSIAIMSSAALIWTYALTSLTILVAAGAIPRTFKPMVQVFISSFWALVFGVLIYLFSPILFYDIQFPVAFTAVLFMISGLGEKVAATDFSSGMKKTIVEALVISLIILLFSLVREPFGFGALSLPTNEGIKEILTSDIASDIAIKSIATASGGLIVLGFIVGLYRIVKDMFLTYYSQRENQ